MATSSTTDVPGLRFNAQGKWIPFTAVETKARGEALQATLDKLDEPDDDALSDEVLRAIDGHRPERPFFKEILGTCHA